MTNQANNGPIGGAGGGGGGGGGGWIGPTTYATTYGNLQIQQSNATTCLTYPSTGAGTFYSTNYSPNPMMQVSGNMDVTGDLIIKGQPLSKIMERIEDRLSLISDPNPRKLEKYAALKEAYEQYKLLEKLINDDDC